MDCNFAPSELLNKIIVNLKLKHYNLYIRTYKNIVINDITELVTYCAHYKRNRFTTWKLSVAVIFRISHLEHLQVIKFEAFWRLLGICEPNDLLSGCQ